MPIEQRKEDGIPFPVPWLQVLLLQLTIKVVVRVDAAAHFPGRLLAPAPAAALMAGKVGRVDLAAMAGVDLADRVGMAGRVDPAGTVARAGLVGRVGPIDTADTVVGIADSRAEKLCCSCRS